MPRPKQSKKDKKERYCHCRSTKSDGFMIICERCEVWYHGDCVGITEKQAKNIPDYFCKQCREKSIGRCANPDCMYETRPQSKYCSDECGEQFNRKRYELYFLPRWNKLRNDPSIARDRKLSEMHKIEEEIKKSIETIGRLRGEKEELERVIALMKSEALRMKKENRATREKSVDKDADNEEDDSDEAISNDQTKTFCVICGTEQLADKAFKHWMLCHKRQESQYNFTSDVPMNKSLKCETDPFPKLYCEKEDKKTHRFCMHIESACPQHSNWQFNKDEVCACPLDVMQELKPSGNFCLELKKDCNLHYNWDRFRLAMKNMERIQEFSRYADLEQKLEKNTLSLRDTYGGVIGVMLHDTKDFKTKMADGDDGSKMIDVD